MTNANELQKKIIKQVEYYFSDINLRKDKFMKEKLQENDGWISLSTLLTFNRLKTLSSDEQLIMEALKLSTNNVIEAGDKGVKRVVPFENPEDDVVTVYGDQTIYIKGFESKSTLDEITEWLDTLDIKYKSVHLRKIPQSKTFKGSIFVIMESEDDAKKFVSDDEPIKFKNNIIIKKMQKDYFEEKKKEFDARHEKKQAHQAMLEKVETAQAESIMVKGVLLELTNLPDNRTDRPQAGEKRPNEENEEPESKPMIVFKKWISDQAGEISEGLWIDIDPTANTAIVKFKKPGAAEEVLKTLKESDVGMMYKDKKIEGRVLEGEEELKYWKTVLSKKKFRGKRVNQKPGGKFKKRR